MAKQSKSVTIDQSALDQVVSDIVAIDVKLDALKGTQAQRKATAQLATLTHLLKGENGKSEPVTVDLPNVIQTPQEALAFFEVIDDIRAEVDHKCGELVSGWLKGQKSDTADEAGQLREQRATLVTQAKALATLLGVDVDIPKRSAGGRPEGSTVKASGAHFFVVIGGERKDMSSSQDSLSSVAWYHGAKLLGTSDRPATADFKKALEGAGVTSFSVPFEVTLEGGTVGMEVIPPAEDK